jgi:hypothetical protein
MWDSYSLNLFLALPLIGFLFMSGNSGKLMLLVGAFKSVVLGLEVFKFLHELNAVFLFILKILLQLLLFFRDTHVLEVV